MTQTPTAVTAAEKIAADLMADPVKTHELLTDLICTAAYLNAKAEWSMEDNFTTTEGIRSDFGAFIPEDQLIGIVGESRFELHPDQVEKRLLPYLPPLEDDQEDDQEDTPQTTTETTPLWFNLNGMLTCRAHALQSLSSALENGEAEIRTSYDLWTRMGTADIQAIDGACETCAHNVRRADAKA